MFCGSFVFLVKLEVFGFLGLKGCILIFRKNWGNVAVLGKVGGFKFCVVEVFVRVLVVFGFFCRRGG